MLCCLALFRPKMEKMALCVFLLASLFALGQCNDKPYKEKYFEQKLDHFNYANYKNGTYKQRYLIQDDFWNAGGMKGPIFFYTGNEGGIKGFYDNCGFIIEIASQFRGKHGFLTRFVIFPWRFDLPIGG